MSDYDEMENSEEINEDLLTELNRQASTKTPANQPKPDAVMEKSRPNMMDATTGMAAGSFTNAMPSPGKQGDPANIDMLMDIALNITVELGRSKMMLREVLELQHGSVVELERLAGDPVDVFVNNRLIARGEVVVVDDKFGVRITELSNKSSKLGSL